MNLPCKVVEDLLPMYCDCLCAEETAALVEDHLKTCPGCTRMLGQLQTDFDLVQPAVDDMKPLAQLGEKWRKSKWRNIRKGVCYAVAAVLLVTAILVGSWFFGYGRQFYQMAECMERTTASDAVITDSDYKRDADGYRFDLWMPSFYGDSGFARVSGQEGMGLFIYPEVGGGYTFKLYLTDEDGRIRFVYLKADLTPDFENYDTLLSAEKEKEAVRQLTAGKKEDIAAMLEAVKRLWAIDLLEYTR